MKSKTHSIEARATVVQTRTAPAGHIPILDGIRGLAVLLVMVCHFSFLGALPGTLSGLDRAYYRLTWAGWMGVDLFFVLSGFLITGILLDSKRSPTYFRTFYGRRILRIFPLYYGFLLVFFILLPLVPHMGVAENPEFRDLSGAQAWFWLYASNLLAGIRGQYLPIINHFWSLAVEEQFYLVWPLVVFWCPNVKTLARVCLAIMAISLGARGVLVAAGANFVSLFHLTFTRMDALAAGALVATALRDPKMTETAIRWGRPIIFSAGALLAGAFLLKDRFASLFAVVGFTALESLFGALVLLLVTEWSGRWIAKPFDSAPLRFCGRYSYGMYVFHVPLCDYMRKQLPEFPADWLIAGSRLPVQGLLLGAGIGAAIVVALVSWHLYEKHFLKLKRYFTYEAAQSSPPRRKVAEHLATQLNATSE